MDFLTSNSQLLLEKSMGFLWTKQAAILDNIANAETPNYKAKVVTFEESLRSRLEQRLASARAVALRGGTEAAQAAVLRGGSEAAQAAAYWGGGGAAGTAGRVSVSSIRQIIQDAQLEVFEAQEQTRMDDNGVNITSEMTELIRNAYQQQYVYQAINKHYSILRMAVRGQ